MAKELFGIGEAILMDGIKRVLQQISDGAKHAAHDDREECFAVAGQVVRGQWGLGSTTEGENAESQELQLYLTIRFT